MNRADAYHATCHAWTRCVIALAACCCFASLAAGSESAWQGDLYRVTTYSTSRAATRQALDEPERVWQTSCIKGMQGCEELAAAWLTQAARQKTLSVRDADVFILLCHTTIDSGISIGYAFFGNPLYVNETRLPFSQRIWREHGPATHVSLAIPGSVKLAGLEQRVRLSKEGESRWVDSVRGDETKFYRVMSNLADVLDKSDTIARRASSSGIPFEEQTSAIQERIVAAVESAVYGQEMAESPAGKLLQRIPGTAGTITKVLMVLSGGIKRAGAAQRRSQIRAILGADYHCTDIELKVPTSGADDWRSIRSGREIEIRCAVGEHPAKGLQGALLINTIRFEQGGLSIPACAELGGICFQFPLVQDSDGTDSTATDSNTDRDTPARNKWQRQLDSLVDLFQ